MINDFLSKRSAGIFSVLLHEAKPSEIVVSVRVCAESAVQILRTGRVSINLAGSQ